MQSAKYQNDGHNEHDQSMIETDTRHMGNQVKEEKSPQSNASKKRQFKERGEVYKNQMMKRPKKFEH